MKNSAQTANGGVSSVQDAVVAEIVVTAQKREQSLQDVSQAISVLSGSQLADRGVRTINDLATSIPTLTVTRTEFNTPILSLRGVGFNENSIAGRPAVTIYVDQVPISFVPESTGVLFDLERVEVLKGPQGTLFGQNSTGGAINFIAAKPTSHFSAGASASIGRFGAIDGNAFVSGPISETLAARLSGQFLRGGAWQHSSSRDETLGDRGLTSARLTLDWKPTERFTANLTASGWTDRSDTLAAQYIAYKPVFPGFSSRPGPGDPFTTASSNRAADWDAGVDYRHDDRRSQIAAQLNYEASDAITLTSISALSEYRFRYNVDQDGTQFRSGLNTAHGNTRSFFQELRANVTIDPLVIMAGLNYQSDRASQDLRQDLSETTARFLAGPAIPLNDVVLSDENRIESKAAFVNVEAEIARGFTLIGGLRYTKDTRDYTFCQPVSSGVLALAATRDGLRGAFGLPPGPALSPTDCFPMGPAPEFTIGPPVSRSLDADNLSWRVAAQAKPQSDLLLYASIARGYKSGSFPFSAIVFVDAIQPVKQESLTDYEVGVKYSASNRLQLNASAFHYDYRNKQVKGNVTTLLGPVLSLINVPKSRVIGAEAEARVRPVDGLTVSASGTWLDTKATDDYFNIDAFSNLFNFKGQSLPFTPKWSGDLDVEYRHDLNGRWEMFVGGHLNYASRQRAQFVDRSDPDKRNLSTS